MTVFQAFAQAENKAITGSDDSQNDSQVILDAYKAEFGVETMSSCSPPLTGEFTVKETAMTDEIQPVIQASEPLPDPLPAAVKDSNPTANAFEKTRRFGAATEVRDAPHWAQMTGMALTLQKKQIYSGEATFGDQDADNTPANIINSTGLDIHEAAEPCQAFDAVLVKESFTRHDSPRRLSDDHNDAPNSINATYQPPSIVVVALSRKMEYSQQTPTQPNDDRDYSEYCDIVPSSPVNDNPQAGSNEPRTLQGDDTGAVNFGNLSELVRPSSQVSEDAGFENTRGEWRQPDGTSQHLSSNAFTPRRPHGPTFETPALPKNPFGAKSTVAAPLAGSQLFGQTQFSSAIKKISPTSSRPSPNLFHHSISPNVIETSPLKGRANVSSPTDIRTSSPQRLHDVPGTSSREKDDIPEEAETPLNSRSTGGNMVPESPHSSDETPRAHPPRSSGNNGPLAHYEPMKKSQERRTIEEPVVSYLEAESDSDDAIRKMHRQKRVQRKRAKAVEEMEKVTFTPMIRRDSSEQPGRKRRRVMSDVAINTTDRTEWKQSKSEEPPLVGDSQNGLVPSNETLPDTLPVQSTKATPGDDTPDVGQVDQDGDAMILVIAENIIVEEEMIPATSPAPSFPSFPSFPPTAPPEIPTPSEPELPTLVVEEEQPRSSIPDISETPSSLPLIRRRTKRTYGRGARQRPKNTFISSSDVYGADDCVTVNTVSSPLAGPVTTATPQKGEKKETAQDIDWEIPTQDTAPPLTRISPPQSSRSELPPAMSTRSKRIETNPITPLAARSLGPMPPTSSSLTILSQTPNPSAKTTPGTQNSPVSDRPKSVTLPSPKKRTLRGGAKSESPQPVTRATRMARRAPRLDSESTDELSYSPSASALEKSMVHSKASRSFRQSLGPTYRTTRLFEDMVFAISFQNGVKQTERNKLETKITQAGGTILSVGFQEMFERSSIMNATAPVIDEEDDLKLTKSSSESGFTALIADSHSRKAKYMQALALGIPCLAQQWIMTCLNKGAIVDWEPYVLCAGASAVLRNAIRSRNLIPYPAVDAKFAEVIDQRLRLLDGQRILVVVDSRKARSEAKEPYIFLATVLGPSISRVFTTQQAREALLEHQKAGNPFDWLYIDKGTGTVEAVLAAPEASGKKRKKSAAQQLPMMGNIRVLNDELVIQSLILGRMVEEDEINF
ncbi:Fc.00g049090.m01.CDS01 [Cosmosporella sp. VM-42]